MMLRSGLVTFVVDFCSGVAHLSSGVVRVDGWTREGLPVELHPSREVERVCDGSFLSKGRREQGVRAVQQSVDRSQLVLSSLLWRGCFGTRFRTAHVVCTDEIPYQSEVIAAFVGMLDFPRCSVGRMTT